MGLSVHETENHLNTKWFTLRLRGHSWLVRWKFSGYMLHDEFWSWLTHYDAGASRHGNLREQRLDLIAEVPHARADQFERELFLIMSLGEPALDTLDFPGSQFYRCDED